MIGEIYSITITGSPQERVMPGRICHHAQAMVKREPPGPAPETMTQQF